MADSVFALNRTLRNRLANLLSGKSGAVAEPARFNVFSAGGTEPGPDLPLNVVVTANEVNNLHGTGPLVKRVCHGWPNVFSIRARNDWGSQDFGDWHVCLSAREKTRAEFFGNALAVLKGRTVRSILCIPFLPDDFYTAIAIQECFGARLCVYMMDDQNVAAHNISDELMEEFLTRCSFRVATHPELRAVYEDKYGLSFSLLPAVVPAALIPLSVTPCPPLANGPHVGALIGSFWDQSWYDRLCAVLAGCSCRIDWFGNNKSPWFDLSPESLVTSGITAHGVVSEERLAAELAKYPFVIVPTGALDGKEANVGVAQLSLPGRILFAIATAHTPVLLIGSEETCGARFVKHFGVGEVAPYDVAAVSAAMDRMREPEAQRRMRLAAARISPVLSDSGVSNWLAHSIDMGTPSDPRFEDLFSGYNSAIDLGVFRRVAGSRR